MPRTKEQRRQDYKKLRAAGKCITCYKPAMKGRACCNKCQKRHNLRNRKREDNRRNNGLCPTCGAISVSDKILCIDCAKYRRERGQQLRDSAINAYGGYSCQCPGCIETAHEFMTIDHIDGGGLEHRREIGVGGSNFYRWLKKHKYPPGYRVLCLNCNASRGLYGYCPHERGYRNTQQN